MNVSCPQCSTIFRVDPAKVPAGGVRARCSTCGGVIPVGIDESIARRTPVAPAASFSPPPYMETPITPQRAMTPPRPMTPPRAMTPPRPVTPRPMTPPRGATLPPLRPTPRTPWPTVATPSAPAPAASSQTPVSVPAETPPPPAPVVPQAPAQPARVASSSTTTQSQPAPGERRPINPFLARDPSLRAKRLARALVSDMVAYYPAKHSEGLQKGTLKELFRDEIKKSYEEYVAQVGADFARTTTHFQEALNEVLGAGKRIF